MGTKPKTRFYAEIGNKPVEVCSVRERGRGQLALMFNNLVAHVARVGNGEEDGKILARAIAEHHMSVHRTNGDRDTVFTMKTLYGDGGRRSEIAFVHDTESELVWPLLFLRFGSRQGAALSPPRAGARDQLLCVGKYEPVFCTMYLAFFVIRTGQHFPEFDNEAIRYTRATFTCFDLVVLTTYNNTTECDLGSSMFCGTSDPVLNEQRRDDHRQRYQKSLSIQDTQVTYWNNIRVLNDDYLERMSVANEAEDAAALFDFCVQHGGGRFTNKAIAEIR